MAHFSQVKDLNKISGNHTTKTQVHNKIRECQVDRHTLEISHQHLQIMCGFVYQVINNKYLDKEQREHHNKNRGCLVDRHSLLTEHLYNPARCGFQFQEINVEARFGVQLEEYKVLNRCGFQYLEKDFKAFSRLHRRTCRTSR